MNKRFLILVVVIIIGALALVGCVQQAPAPAPTQAPKPTAAPSPSPAPVATPAPTAAPPATVSEIKMTCLPLGSTGYSSMVGIAEALKDKGLRLRIIPGGSETARILPVRAGEADLGFALGSSTYFISHGIGTYSTEDWGPQPLRIVWNGNPGGSNWIVRGDSGIKTMADLKGKTILNVPGSMMFERSHEAYLAFANLTYKDVKVKMVASSPDGFKAILDGTGDSMNLASTAAGAYELASSSHGVWMVPIPAADKEGWKRLQKIAPFYSPWATGKGAGPQFEKGGKVETSLLPYIVFAYPKTSESISYTLTKGIWETYEAFKGKAPGLDDWTHDLAIAYKMFSHPFADGTIKFFKEAKVWTPAMEEWQNKQLKLEKARLDAWEPAKKAATDKKIKLDTPQWATFWEDWLIQNNIISYPE